MTPTNVPDETIVQKLTPQPPLTPAEQALFDRARTFVVAALGKVGIQPSQDQSYWLGAAVADFVTAEKAK